MGPVCCVRFCAAAVRQAPSRVKSPTHAHHTAHARHESRRGAYVPALAYWMMDINNCDISRVVAGGFSRTVEGAR